MIVNYLTLFAFTIMFVIFRVQHRDMAARLDENADTASDYTIKIKKFPNPGRDYDIDDEIKDFIEKAEGGHVKVRKVNLVYDLTEYRQLFEDKNEAILEK